MPHCHTKIANVVTGQQHIALDWTELDSVKRTHIFSAMDPVQLKPIPADRFPRNGEVGDKLRISRQQVSNVEGKILRNWFRGVCL